MTERNTSSGHLSDRDVERLLQQFFVEEVPAEFRPQATPVAPARPQPVAFIRTTTSKSSRKFAGLLGIVVSATCCLVAVMFLPDESRENAPSEVPAMTGENDRTEPAAGDSLPIEERSHLPYTTTSETESPPGSNADTADPLGPELEIEIYPLRPHKPGE